MTAGTARIEGVNRIAVLRANALGDFIFTLPALDALKATYPQAELVLLGATWHERWLRGRPGPVDRVLVVPPEGIRPAGPGERPVESASFLARAREERFDLALQLHGGGATSNPLVNRLGAKLTAGLRTPDAEPLDRWIRYVYFQPEIFRYLEVVALVGAAPVGITPRVRLAAGDLAEAHSVVGPPTRPRVAIHPGAKDARRRWPTERFAEIADALAAQSYEVVVTGDASEHDLVAQVVATARHPVRPLAGALTLGGLTGLYAECAGMVANDTGPLHLATALGTPTVGIYWLGNFVNCAPPMRARHRPVASWTANCPACGAASLSDIYPERDGPPGCAHRVSHVTDVPVAEVLSAVCDLLDTA